MSEQAIQEGIQAVLQAMTEFADADVVINEWGVLDQPNSNAPYVIISNADDFVSRQDTTEAETTWQEVVALYERFTDWPTTLGNLRTRRQAIIDKFNEVSSNRAAGQAAGVTMDEIRNDGPIEPFYGPYIAAEAIAEALPQFLMQTLIMTVTEF